MSHVTLRDSIAADVPAIAAIYAHWVRHGLASFELDPPAPDEIARRRHAVLAAGFPYLVVEGPEGEIDGFAYASWYRTRPAYRFSCEDSVYVRHAAVGRGVGRALLAALIERCTGIGCRRMIAVIGDSGNAASIGLHRRAGFEPAGVLPAVGWKFGRWVDSVLMARPLGDGSATVPAEHGRPIGAGAGS